MMSLKPAPKEYGEEKAPTSPEGAPMDLPPLEDLQKGRWERSWPTIACGAGLFSDGYLNGVCIQCLSISGHYVRIDLCDLRSDS